MASAISNGDATLWRTHPQVSNGYLWVDKPPIVYQGLVNQAAAFTYPIVDPIPVDNETGTIGDVQVDMLVTFGTTAGGDDLGRTRVLGITATHLGIPRISRGTVDGTVNLSDNIHFTIYDSYPIAPKIPFFDEAVQTFYKDGDDAFVAALPPVANIGYAHIYADLVNSSDKLVLTIDSTDSFSPIGGTLTRLWDVDDGTITAGSTSTTAITVEFPVGRRHVKLTLTDTTNSRVTIRHLLVVACKFGDANYAPITDAVPSTLSQTVEGLRMSFKFGQDIPVSTYLDGVPVCYFQREFYGSTEDTLHDAVVVKFAGWHHSDPARMQAQQTHELTETTLDCLDTAGKLATLPGFPQTIESEASPIRWEQMASPNMDKFLAYLWLYHSTAPSLVDFTWSGTTTTYPFVRLNSMGNSLYAQIDGRAKAIGYRLLSSAKGRCKVKKDSMLFDSGSRDSTNVITLTEADICAITYTHQRPPRSHWNRGNAVVANASAVNAVFCIAPGVVPAWGLSASELGENLVASQTELNARVGHSFQRENASETYVEVELLHGGDIGLEPLDFVRITLGSTYAAQRGLTWTTQRFMVVAINTDYDPTYGTKRVRLTLEREVFGTPAETVVPEPNPLPDITPVIDLYPPDDTVVTAGEGTLAVFTADGNLHITNNFNTPSSAGGPTWDAPVSLGVLGVVIKFVADPYSPFYVSGSGDVNGWLVTTQRIYKIDGVFGTPSVTSQFTFRADNSTGSLSYQGRNIDASFGTQNWLICVSVYDGSEGGGDRGVWATYTTDGSTWATEVQITSNYNTNVVLNDPGLYISSKTAGLAYTSAFTSSNVDTPTSVGKKTTNHGASWGTTLTDPDLDSVSLSALHVPFDDNPGENIAYFGQLQKTPLVQKLFRADGTSVTDITPLDGSSNPYYPNFASMRSIATSLINRQCIVVCGEYLGTFPNASFFTVFASQTGGPPWSIVSGPTAPGSGILYAGVAMDGSNQNVFYLMGTSGGVAYTSNFGATIDERGPGGSSLVIGIAGG